MFFLVILSVFSRDFVPRKFSVCVEFFWIFLRFVLWFLELLFLVIFYGFKSFFLMF